MRRVIISALAMVAIASCSKNEGGADVSASSSDAPIFNQAAITRVTDGKWEADDQVGLYMIQEQAPVTIDQTTYANYPYNVETAGASASDFTADDAVIYFPVDKEARVGFFAYYPYQAEATTTNKYQVDVTTQSTPADIDFLEASVENNGGEVYHKDNAEVALKFSHALSKLSLTVEVGDEVEATAADIAAMRVAIKGYNTTVDYDFATNDFGTPATVADIAMRQVAADGSHYDAILIPTEAVAESEIIFSIGDEDFSWDISEIALAKGQENKFSIKIVKSSVTVKGSTINDWGTGIVGEGTAE